MQMVAEPRLRKRLPCELTIEGRRHAGIVLNLSPRGLYVQSNAGPRAGSRVNVDLSAGPSGESIRLRGSVVWRRVRSRQLTGTTQSGFGVLLDSPPVEYVSWLDPLLPSDPARPVPAAGTRYRVRARLSGSPRTRRIEVTAPDEDAACELVLAELGEGWSVLELVALAAGLEADQGR